LHEGNHAAEAVLLDVDGTLIDSNRAHADAWSDALREHGYDVSSDRALRVIGMGGDKVMPELTGLSLESERGQAIDARRRDLFRERYLPRIRALPGAAELAGELQRRGRKLVVASSAEPELLKDLLAIAGLAELAHCAAAKDDDTRSKPDPDIVESALERAGVSGDRAVLLGDTPYDVAAARRAGVSVVALRSGGWDDAALAGAIAVYDHPADVLSHLDESPLARLFG
jgi:HAD superfamily hydrolase (TIGR01509 family)